MRNPGKLFEDDFKASVPKNTYYLRLHDSATGFSHPTDDRVRFSMKSPYDAILCQNGQMICVELKSISTVSASFVGSSPRIKIRQVKELQKAKKEGGARSYLVINFRKFHETYAIDPDDFLTWVSTCGRKSISITTARMLGIHLPEQKKRVRYRYDLTPILRNQEKEKTI